MTKRAKSKTDAPLEVSGRILLLLVAVALLILAYVISPELAGGVMMSAANFIGYVVALMVLILLGLLIILMMLGRKKPKSPPRETETAPREPTPKKETKAGDFSGFWKLLRKILVWVVVLAGSVWILLSAYHYLQAEIFPNWRVNWPFGSTPVDRSSRTTGSAASVGRMTVSLPACTETEHRAVTIPAGDFSEWVEIPRGCMVGYAPATAVYECGYGDERPDPDSGDPWPCADNQWFRLKAPPGYDGQMEAVYRFIDD